MSGVTGTGTHDLRKLAAMLGDLQANGVQRYTKALSEEAVRQIKLGFRQSRAPSGAGWKPLLFRVGQPLRKTGRLQNSFTREVRGRTSFVIGTNVMYTATHQYGAEIRPKRAKFLAFQVPKARSGFGSAR